VCNLVVYNVVVAESFSHDVSRFFSGLTSGKAIWLMIGGIVAVVAGSFDLLRIQPKGNQKASLGIKRVFCDPMLCLDI